MFDTGSLFHRRFALKISLCFACTENAFLPSKNVFLSGC
jgi:hypothetical protein